MNVENIINNIPILWQGSQESLYMTFTSTLFAYILGLPLGILIIITSAGGLKPNRFVNTLLGWIVNLGRSIPFIILIVAIIPFTRMLVGTSIGSTAAIVPLVIAAAPFVARMVETSVKELDYGVIEAAKSMGASDWQIIYKVMLPEIIPSLIRGVSITTITVLGYSAMAGAVGGGGLGDIAIRQGYQRYQGDIIFVTVVILLIIVALIQIAFDIISKAVDRRNK